MAYTPKTWACGETITAEKLNNIEEGIQEALECCEGGGGGNLIDFSWNSELYTYESEAAPLWEDLIKIIEDGKVPFVIVKSVEDGGNVPSEIIGQYLPLTQITDTENNKRATFSYTELGYAYDESSVPDMIKNYKVQLNGSVIPPHYLLLTFGSVSTKYL